MTRPFEPSEINGMVLPNRFVRSATWDGMAADDGACTPEMVALMARLAEGGGRVDHHGARLCSPPWPTPALAARN